MPWADGTFALVVTWTVFSSILSGPARAAVAAEIVRVLRPGGALLYYDFAWNNPRNPNVRGVRSREVTRLFSEPARVGSVGHAGSAAGAARRAEKLADRDGAGSPAVLEEPSGGGAGKGALTCRSTPDHPAAGGRSARTRQRP